MALIKCPECNKQVSDAATSCPSCAYPINQGQTAGIKGVRTIEATGKRWKGLQLMSVVAIIFGLIILFNLDLEQDNPAVVIIILIVGVAGYIYARFGAWWHHD